MYLHNSAQVLIVLVKHLDDVLWEAFHSRVFVVVSVVTRKIFGVRISTRAWTNTWSVSHTRFETRLSHFLFPYCRIHCNTKMCQFLYSLTYFLNPVRWRTSLDRAHCFGFSFRKCLQRKSQKDAGKLRTNVAMEHLSEKLVVVASWWEHQNHVFLFSKGIQDPSTGLRLPFISPI